MACYAVVVQLSTRLEWHGCFEVFFSGVRVEKRSVCLSAYRMIRARQSRRPWISPLERSHCAFKLDLPLTAMIEGIGDDPALADTSGDPDAMTSALLPAVDSRYDMMPHA